MSEMLKRELAKGAELIGWVIIVCIASYIAYEITEKSTLTFMFAYLAGSCLTLARAHNLNDSLPE